VDIGQFTAFETIALWGTLGTAVIGIIYGLMLRKEILDKDPGTEKMQQIAGQIQEGASAYLNRQFKTIIGLVVVLFIALTITGWMAGTEEVSGAMLGLGRGIAFLLGCFASGLTGFVGMNLAVRGNVRCAAAARTSVGEALAVAFRSGAVAGMFTVAMGLIGATIIFMVFKAHATEILLGFGFGGSLLALFMRVGGGIYTKAADVGADLVGKVEAGIPEDDPRNAAVIADNVGDNVGDCAGMAADIFESYEVTLVASMILALAHAPTDPDLARIWIIFPLIVRGIGVITSIIGTNIVKLRNEQEHPMAPITRGFVWSALLSAFGFFFVAWLYAGDLKLFWATFAGLVLAIGIYKLTEYYTSNQYPPVQEIAAASQTGSATNLLAGFGVGLEGTVWALLAICACLFFSILVFGGEGAIGILYGVSLVGLGMLTTTGVVISMDTYGPVADNAQGICEMADVPEAMPVVEVLDAVGNTTKAATKGLAIASAVIAAIALFGSFVSKVAAAQMGGAAGEAVSASAVESLMIPVNDPHVFIGLLIGGAMPFLFSSMTIRAVGRAAFQIINEVRRQFREIPGLMEGKAMPESAKVVDICTASAIRELVAPGLLAVLSPIIVGAWFGWLGLGGFLAGIIVTGQLMAVLLCDAGGAWDNAKKVIEDGAYGGKGSDAHAAAVVGDTVGDPFKDTAGPALNPLIKVMNLVGLLVVPIIVRYEGTPGMWITGILLAAVVGVAMVKAKSASGAEVEVHERVGSGDVV
jgi:K(+)-stimulated pyrophosphate-energized sodium pump